MHKKSTKHADHKWQFGLNLGVPLSDALPNPSRMQQMFWELRTMGQKKWYPITYFQTYYILEK